MKNSKKLVAILLLFSFFNSFGMSDLEERVVALDDKLDELEEEANQLSERITILEAEPDQKPTVEEKPTQEKTFQKCKGDVCERITQRKFHHLRNKPQDPNNPKTLVKCAKGRCRKMGAHHKRGGRHRRRQH